MKTFLRWFENAKKGDVFKLGEIEIKKIDYEHCKVKVPSLKMNDVMHLDDVLDLF